MRQLRRASCARRPASAAPARGARSRRRRVRAIRRVLGADARSLGHRGGNAARARGRRHRDHGCRWRHAAARSHVVLAGNPAMHAVASRARLADAARRLDTRTPETPAMKLIECVPNFSEGRRPEVVAAIRDAIAAVTASVLDVSSDAVHNRTRRSPSSRRSSAWPRRRSPASRRRASTIDLTAHSGEHPRMGAADVVPFIPLEGATMEDCVALARALGERVGKRARRFPSFSTSAPRRVPRARISPTCGAASSRGSATRSARRPQRTPDFGPSASASHGGRDRDRRAAISRRVQRVSRTARRTSGGQGGREGGARIVGRARYVKAMGLEVDGQAQVSMNLVDTEKTPLHRAYDMVKMEAAGARRDADVERDRRARARASAVRRGGAPPAAAQLLAGAGARAQGARGGERRRVAERLRRAAVASSKPAPGGGSARRTRARSARRSCRWWRGSRSGKKKYADVEPTIKRDRAAAAALGEAARGSSWISMRSRTRRCRRRTSFRRRRPSRKRCARPRSPRR